MEKLRTGLLELGALFAAPSRTMARAAARGSVLPPIVATVLASLLLAAAVVPRVDWAKVAERSIDQGSAGQMTPHEREQAVEQARKLGAVKAYAGAAVGPALSALLVAFLLFLALRVAGARPPFRPTLSVAAWGLLPTALGKLLSLPAALRSADLSPDGVSRLVPWNAASHLPHDASAALQAAAGSIDLFALGAVVFVALGMASVAQVSRLRAGTAVAALWAALVAVGMNAAALSAAT